HHERDPTGPGAGEPPAMITRPVRVTLLLLATLAVACATSAPRETAPAGEGPSVVSPEDREMVDRMNEGIGIQGRQLFAAQAEAAPDCPRVCQLVGNICGLSEK